MRTRITRNIRDAKGNQDFRKKPGQRTFRPEALAKYIENVGADVVGAKSKAAEKQN